MVVVNTLPSSQTCCESGKQRGVEGWGATEDMGRLFSSVGNVRHTSQPVRTQGHLIAIPKVDSSFLLAPGTQYEGSPRMSEGLSS